ncbi:MAG: hypothetical protein MUC83_01025 [Pirellula sp.]|nr:hypothetical protein [Pirellula sp.]
MTSPSSMHAAARPCQYETLDQNLRQVENLLCATGHVDGAKAIEIPDYDKSPIYKQASLTVELEDTDSIQNTNSSLNLSPSETSGDGSGSIGSVSPEDVNSAVLSLFDNKLQQIIESSAQLERERLEIQELRRQLQHAIDSAELRMAMVDRSSVGSESATNTGLIDSLRAENDRLTSLLNHTRSEYQTLLDFIENEDIKELTTNVRNEHLERECELNREIDRLKDKIRLLEDDLGSSIGTGSEAELKKQLASVRNELMEARHEVVDLRLQCNELASRLAKFQDPSTVNHDTVSWEDRKQALLHMLEQQDQEELESIEKVLEMKHILEETSVQIQIREKEIADLRSLLEQQSVAANGFAVGAAAIANLVDADEIVAEERQRLKEMQLQWEQKQRQGEIEMSLERAKLARERLEIQDKVQQLEAERDLLQRENENRSQASPAPHKGRWWARLGLKDD